MINKDAGGLDLTKESDKKALLDKIELIKPAKLVYTKPLAIIYNPFSGRKVNIKPLITTRLDMEKIPYELLESK